MIHPPPNTDWADAKARRESRLVWRGLILAFVLLVIATPLLFNYFAAREWEETRAKFIADGETLDFHKLLPPTVPEADNFFAIPELKDIALVAGGDPEAGEPGRKRAALKSLFCTTEGEPRFVSNGRLLSEGLALGDPIDLIAWREALADGILALPTNKDAAYPALLKAIDVAYPDLAPLLKGSERPLAQFTPSPRDREWKEPLIASSSPQIFACFSMTRLLTMRATVAASANNSEAAFESLRTHFRMCEAFNSEPLLIAALVSLAIRTTGYESLWYSMKCRSLNEGQLFHLQQQLNTFEATEYLLFALRTELAALVDTDNYLKTHRSASRLLVPADFDKISVIEFVPNGYFDHNTALAVRLEHELLFSPIKAYGFIGGLDGDFKLRSEKERLEKHWTAPLNSLVLPSLDVYAGIAQKCFYISCRHDQALTAIALERYFLKYQHYPDALQKLVPEFLTEVPNDPHDSQPIRYTLMPDGRFKLWHIGFDGVDDGGEVKFVAGERSSHRNSPDYLGDWVWQYTPVPKSP